MLKNMFRAVTPAATLAVLFSAHAHSAALQNGDFTDGFEHWTGETTDISFTDETWTASEMQGPSLVSALFEIPVGGGEVTLFTDNTYYHTGIFQAFDVNASQGGPITISFDFNWALTDNVDRFDFVQASLDHAGGLEDLFDSLDKSALTASGSINYDITNLAGEPVTLSFFVEDGGDDIPDQLTIGNIQVNVAVAPIPGTAILVAAGLIGLFRMRA
jgi:hypothetical protein